MMRRLFLLFAALACAACSRPRPQIDPAVAAVANADSLVSIGCYACLKEAFVIYENAGRSEQAFTTALLLAAREKELGLDAIQWIERAQSLGASPDAATYVDIVKALNWESAGLSADFEPTRSRDEQRTAWDAFLTRPGASDVDTYLRIALVCRYSYLPIERTPWLQEIDPARPLVRYRLGICSARLRAHLEAAAQEPRFVETSFFLGRYELAGFQRDRLTRALPLLRTAYEGVPESPIVAVALAGVHRGRRELERALEMYDRALALRPAQREALLGRTITLTYLSRHADAVATATRMLELATWYMGDAHYWRAWNEYHLRDLDAAARDVADAKKFQVNSDVLTLSGIVAFDQRRLDDARSELESARQMNDANCTAGWYLGLVHVEQKAWPQAADVFTAATVCYRAEAEAARTEIDQLPADVGEDVRAREVADRDRRITESLRQEARSAFNAAQCWLKLGNRERAVEHAQVAVGHADMRDKAEALLKTIR
jgi:tetratricopeptide (TPR) repeat protein